jgi:hypothetical protein
MNVERTYRWTRMPHFRVQFSLTAALPPSLFLADCIINIAEFEFSIGTGNVRRVVMQEGPPSLAGRPSPFDHVLGDARLPDLKPKLEQLSMNARRAPQRIRDKPIAPASPWQNPFIERLIRSIRRECVDHIIVLGEAHLRRILKNYDRYYNECRTHLSLNKDAPLSRAVQLDGRITDNPVLGGLHHQYCRI